MKLNISIFDFLAATIPGIPILLIVFCLKTYSPFSTETINMMVYKSSTEKSILFILASYFIGFLFQYPSYEIFKKLVPIWGNKRTKGLDISIGKRGRKISKMREKAPENYKILEVFLALRIMCYNSFFTLMIFSFLDFFILFRKGSNNSEQWILFFLIFLLMILSLRRAVSFHEWSQSIITDTDTN